MVDDAGRERILAICTKIRAQAPKLSHPEKMRKLQAQLQQAALGQQEWQKTHQDPQTLPKLEVPRDATPLSLFDWRVWSKARPNLWRYGDGGNLDPKRTVPLLTYEWISCLCLREEMEYDLETDTTPFRVCDEDSNESEVNRFASDWITLHLFQTLYYLQVRRIKRTRVEHQRPGLFMKTSFRLWKCKLRDQIRMALLK